MAHTDAGAHTRGYTLPELLITIAILGILTSVVGSFLVYGINFFRLSTAKGEVQRDARQCLDLINRNVRQAVSTSIVIKRFDANQPPYSMIEYSGIDGNKYRYYQLNGQFYMALQNGGSGPWQTNKMADNLRNLSFSYPQNDIPGILSVSVSFQKSTYKGASKTIQLSVQKVRVMN